MSLNPNAKMPFGKYKGTSIDNIRLCDPQYIVWLHDKADLRGEVAAEVAACYDDCVATANKKISSEPQKRKSISRISCNLLGTDFGAGEGKIDFLGNYSDDHGAEIPNMGYMTNEEMDDHGHSMGGYDE